MCPCAAEYARDVDIESVILQTASTLTFAIYMLSDHPDMLTRLRSDILEMVGQHGRPTYEDIKEMKFLRAVINETLRLFPAV